MKKLYLFILLMCFGAVCETAYPTVYMAGAFNNWDLNAPATYQVDNNGVYSINITINDGQNDLKMSFSEPSGNSVEDKWGSFDISSFGLNLPPTTQWTTGLHDLTYHTKNSNLPSGEWVITVYPEQEKIAFTKKGDPVPVPGNDEENPDFPKLYVVGDFQGWNPAEASVYTADNEGVFTLNLTVNSGAQGYKMSFAEPKGDNNEARWAAFDQGSFGKGDNEEWVVGTYPIQSQTSNTVFPVGSWTLKIYYNLSQMTFSSQGSDIPTPGDGTSGTLPVLYINVYNENGQIDNEVIDYNLSHKDYFNGKYWLDMKGCDWMGKKAENVGSKENPLDLQIKARGNYTRTGFSKKPFKLKLDKKQALLGLTKSKHFAILAHADDDYGFLRNFTGFELGKRIGLPWTPSQQPVEVVINGNYRGLYFLTESIRIDEDRVNIVEGKDNETEKENISGGYIVELDNYDEDYSSQIQMDEKHCARGGHYYDKLRITFDTPEVYSDLQRRFVTDQFSAMNNAVGMCDRSDELWKYMDLDDAARYYLVNEIISHTESYHGSTYLFRDHGNGEKWHFSPLWDMGNAFNGSTNDFFYNGDPFGNTWIPSIRENKTFNDKVKATWLWFMSNCYDGIEAAMDEYIGHITTAAALDYQRWNANNIPQKSKNPSRLSDALNSAKRHLQNKTSWLKGQFGDYTGATFTEPERDTTPAAELPDYAQTGVEDVNVDCTDADGGWYNLQGQPVSSPVRGNLYVTPKGVIRY